MCDGAQGPCQGIQEQQGQRPAWGHGDGSSSHAVHVARYSKGQWAAQVDGQRGV